MRVLWCAVLLSLFVAVPDAAHAAGRRSFDFDAGLGGLRVAARDGGGVTLVPGVSGTAVAFPARCCGRAVLIADGTGLDPGLGRLEYGAHVRLDQGETSAGSNVLQKGTWSANSQWKLQIDGRAGHPSCAVMGVGSRRMHVAVAPVPVADGQWHQVTCVRDADRLSITVDGVMRGSVGLPAGLSISSGAPLRIGGNGLRRGADTFHGAVDNLYVAIG
jgi:concanavalin A-like lectin/glucanase superfamily protein